MLAQAFNSTVLSDLASVETGADALKVFTLDTYDLLGDVVASPAENGFTNVTEPCISVVACLTAPPSVQDTYLFWDGLHPTEGVHMLTAELAYALVAPEPSTWAMMLIGFAGLGFAGYRRAEARLRGPHMSAAISAMGRPGSKTFPLASGSACLSRASLAERTSRLAAPRRGRYLMAR